MEFRPRIALLGSPLDNFYSREFWRGASEAAQKAGADLVYLAGGVQVLYPGPVAEHAPPNEPRSDLLYRMVRPEDYDGVLVWGAQWNHDTDEAGILAELAPFLARPVVSVGTRLGQGVYNLTLDNYPGARALVDHLIEVHGIRDIVMLKSEMGVPSTETETRFRAYREALVAHGIAWRDELVVTGDEIADRSRENRNHTFAEMRNWAFPAMAYLLDDRGLVPGRDFHAVFATDDNAALAAVEALQSRGFRVPEDVAVCGFDDIIDGRCSRPLLTTVRQDFADLAGLAVNQLLDLIAGKAFDFQRVADQTRLVVRQSCGCPSAPVGLDAAKVVEELDRARVAELAARVSIERKQDRLDDFNQTVISSFDFATATQAVVRELPELKIPGCFLSEFADPAQPFGTARLLFAHRAGVPMPALSVAGQEFPAADLVPFAFRDSTGGPRSWVVNLLLFHEQRLGFIVFERGTDDARPYHSLTVQLSSVLAGAHLVDSLRRQSEALEASNLELRAAQVRLVEAEKQKALGGLVRGLAHHINTPLGNGLLALSLLEEQVATVSALGDRAGPVLGLVRSSLEEAAKLTHHFKLLSLEDLGDPIQWVNVTDLVHQSWYTVKNSWTDRDVGLVSEVPPDLETRVQPGALLVVLSQIFENALCHGYQPGQKGSVTVSVVEEPGRLVLDVVDTGRGIPAAVLPHVFEPFFVHTVGATRRGVGLGLHIAFSLLVEGLGGELSCQSVEGEGARFRLRIPVSLRRGQPSGAPGRTGFPGPGRWKT